MLEFESHLLLFNGRPLNAHVSRFQAVEWFTQVCLERKIRSILFEEGLDQHEFHTFISLFHADPMDFSDQESATRILHRGNVRHITVNVPSLDGTFSSLPSTDLLPNLKQPEPEPPRPSGGREAGMNREMVFDFEAEKELTGPRLFITEQHRSTLSQSMIRFIHENNLKRVARALSMIRDDLTSEDRELRELAFSSYHVVVDCLVRENQNKPLVSIIKSLMADFHECREPDLFSVHLSTLNKMIRYFKGSGQIGPLVYGLNILANQVLSQDETCRAQAEESLDAVLDLSLTERLFLLKSEELKPLLKSLFGQHGVGVLKQMLHALYESRDRNMRKRLLEAIRNLGPITYPTLLMELEASIRRSAPWYIKRNLVTLLSNHPPEELTPLLEDLGHENNARLNELIARCVFQIHGSQAHKMASDMLRETMLRGDEKQMKKYLGYIAANRGASYIPQLIQIYEADPPEKIKHEIIHTMARLESSDSIEFLGTILGKHSLFSRKEESEMRLEAGKALMNMRTPEAISCLTRYSHDSSREVRTVARKMLAEIEAGIKNL